MARNCCRYFTVSLVPAAALILAVLFGCGIILLPILYAEFVKDYVYGVVIDAGSSHTHLYIYRWQVPSVRFTQSSTGKAEEIFSCSNTTSVNSKASDPHMVSEAFTSCLNQSYQPYFNEPIVPKEQRGITQLFLGATAGMRLVREQNKTLSKELMTNIEVALNNPNISQYKYNSSKILSGSEEARSGWVTANFLYQNRSKFVPGKTIGALDMGGASTQISFESSTTSSPYHVQEKVFGSIFSLYSRSLLCYGENEAYSRFLAYLIKKNSGGTSVPNPCLPKGMKVTVPSSSIYTACVTSQTALEVFGYTIPPPPSLSSAQSYTFLGRGNSSQCREDINTTLNFCIVGNCNGSSYTAPPVAGHFKAFSGFYFTAHFFNSSNSTFSSSTGWTAFTSTVNTFCNFTDEYIKSTTPFKDDKYIDTRCFAGQFVTLLLENGYGFKQGTGQWSVEFRKKLDDCTLGWALGYMLEQSSAISQSSFYEMHPYTVVDLVVGVVILFILCVIFVTFFFLTCYACRKAISSRSGYQNI